MTTSNKLLVFFGFLKLFCAQLILYHENGMALMAYKNILFWLSVIPHVATYISHEIEVLAIEPIPIYFATLVNLAYLHYQYQELFSSYRYSFFTMLCYSLNFLVKIMYTYDYLTLLKKIDVGHMCLQQITLTQQNVHSQLDHLRLSWLILNKISFFFFNKKCSVHETLVTGKT